MTTTIKTSGRRGQFVAFVDDVRVRFKRMEHTAKRDWQWHCDVHGRHMFATCAHQKIALAAWRARKAEADD